VDGLKESYMQLKWKRFINPCIWMILIMLYAAIPFLTGGNRYYIHLFTMVAIIVLVSQGLNLLLGYAGLVSLGHAGFWAVGAYTYASLTTLFSVNPWLAVIGALVMSALVGAILGLPALRLKGHYLAMMTIGFGIIIVQLLNEWEGITGGVMGINAVPAPSIFGETISATGMFYMSFLLALLCVLFIRNLALTRSGRSFMAFRENETAAITFGIPIYNLKVGAFVLSAVIAGLGGILYAATVHYVSPDTFNYSFSVMFLAILIVGGLGTVVGPILGTIILFLGPEQLQQFNEYRQLIYGVALLACVLFLPKGVVSAFHWVKKKDRTVPDDIPLGNDIVENQLASETIKTIHDNFKFDVNKYASQNLPILEVKELYKHFDGVVAIDHINLKVKAGNIHGLIGPNGSGKTTLVHTISKIYNQDEGYILFAGKDISEFKDYKLVSKGICRTFQMSQLFKSLTVTDNIIIGQNHWRRAGMVQGVTLTKFSRQEEKESRDLALQLLEYFGLDKYKDAIAGDLPYGSQRMLEIVRAVASKPSLLFLDEPAAGMNPAEAKELVKQLNRIKELGITIVLIEHNMDLIMNICDYITVLSSGVIIAEGSPKEIQNNTEVVSAYLGSQSRKT